MIKNKRPKNLNLFTIHFPIPAIVSILHRMSGIVLFFLLPGLLWVFNASLSSERDFDDLQRFFSFPMMKILLWLLLTPLCFHMVAGIRHLLMDIHIGEELKSGRRGAWLTIVMAILLVILLGVWLW